MSRRLIIIIIAVVALGGGAAAWFVLNKPKLPEGFSGGNGRLEATVVYVAAKYPGRIDEVLVDEGDTVEAGQVVARMDTEPLQAQLREAEADIVAARDSRSVALSQVAVRQAEYDFAGKQYARSRGLVTQGAVSEQEAEIDAARMQSSRAELAGARAQAVQTLSAITAAQATADRIRAEIEDAVLVSPIKARIETRLAEPGEVLASGGRVFSLVDLSDVYMYVFLPQSATGKIRLGSEARIVLDAAPDYPIKAYVAFVSPMAQFTPKTVETAEERHDLTFRVKLQIDRERLRQFGPLVKTGIPGMGYVRANERAAWPEMLRTKPVPPNLWTASGAEARR
jgi:HlyD family secretion protein